MGWDIRAWRPAEAAATKTSPTTSLVSPGSSTGDTSTDSRQGGASGGTGGTAPADQRTWGPRISVEDGWEKRGTSR